MSAIKGKIAQGAAWMVLFKFVERGIGLVSTIVLARLLVPADFGLIAMAMSIIAVLELMGAFGFDVTLIQRVDARTEHYNTAWTFNVIFAVACAVLLLPLASPAAAFYQEPRLEAVMYALALGTLVQGFENIGVVSFRRNLQFDREFKFLVAKKIATVAVTIPLAFIMRSYWALVIGVVFGKVVSLALSYALHPFRPRLSLAASDELFSFSKWLLANNIVYLLNNRSADFIIGKLAGAQSLGLYSVAYEISNLPTTELVAPINRAAFPGYSRLAEDMGKLSDGFLSVIAMIALFALPLGTGIALVANPLVPALLGEKWLPAVPLIQILALNGIIMALQTNIGYVYLAVGKPRLVTLLSCLQLVILLAGLFALTPAHGATGAAWAFLITGLTLIPVNQALITARLKIPLARYLGKVWRPVVATLAMSAVVFGLKSELAAMATTPGRLLNVLILALGGALTYGASVVILWRLSASPDGAERFCLDRIMTAVGKVRLKGDSAG